MCSVRIRVMNRGPKICVGRPPLKLTHFVWRSMSQLKSMIFCIQLWPIYYSLVAARNYKRICIYAILFKVACVIRRQVTQFYWIAYISKDFSSAQNSCKIFLRVIQCYIDNKTFLWVHIFIHLLEFLLTPMILIVILIRQCICS